MGSHSGKIILDSMRKHDTHSWELIFTLNYDHTKCGWCLCHSENVQLILPAENELFSSVNFLVRIPTAYWMTRVVYQPFKFFKILARHEKFHSSINRKLFRNDISISACFAELTFPTIDEFSNTVSFLKCHLFLRIRWQESSIAYGLYKFWKSISYL